MKSTERSDFDAHAEALSLPLSMRRAKGRTFDVAGRLRAGLSQDYVDALRVYERSRGRPPRVWIFNPGVDASFTGKSASSAMEASVRADLAPLLGFLANRQDCVLCPRVPSVSFRERLREVGWRMPEFLEAVRLNNVELGHALIEDVVPWGLGPDVAASVSAWPIREQKPLWRAPWRRFYSKAWAASKLREWVANNDEPRCSGTDESGRRLGGMEQVKAALAGGPLVLKRAYSTSGRERRFVTTEDDLANVGPWVERQLSMTTRS